MTPEEQQALEDRDWWRDFGAQFGWRLYGFTYRNGATFFTSDQGRIEITGDQKEAIATTIREAAEAERLACKEAIEQPEFRIEVPEWLDRRSYMDGHKDGKLSAVRAIEARKEG